MTSVADIRGFLNTLSEPFTAARLFDYLPDIVYFIKDDKGRYVEVNQTLVERCSLHRKEDILGHTPSEVLGKTLGERYEKQDAAVVANGQPIADLLEMHVFPDHTVGWCKTTKLPLFDKNRKIVGVVGVSQDLRIPDFTTDDFQHVSVAVRAAESDLGAVTSVAEMAEIAEMSAYQLDRRMRRVFGLTAGQWLIKARITKARQRLVETRLPIATIALEIGYSDQSAFTRQFHKSSGMPPSRYRKLAKQ